MTASSKAPADKPRLHFVLAPKGGVGKSVSGLVLGSYFGSTDRQVLYIDTDAQNANLQRIKKLDALHIRLTEGADPIQEGIDELVEQCLSAECDVLVDVGAGSYFAVAELLTVEGFAEVAHKQGKILTANIIVAGGPRYLDTLNGLDALAKQLPTTAEIVVWTNPHAGPLELQGKPFETSKVFARHKDRIQAIVAYPELRPRDFGRDFSTMIANNQTFEEFISDPGTSVMTAQRVTMTRDKLYGSLKAAEIYG